ncbi:MAG: DUF3795 domain-containing protein [bacterium]|nr:DUF3795 domain-containing protein [bacterium]
MKTNKFGYCGYNCGICPARSKNKETRRKMVEVWKKVFGHQMYTEENMPIAEPCPGCKAPGPCADTVCKARPCAKSKGLESCVDCDEFPCKKVAGLLATAEGMFIFTLPKKNIQLSEEEFNLGMRQFDSMPGILKMLIDKGKAPKWIKTNYEWGFKKK